MKKIINIILLSMITLYSCDTLDLAPEDYYGSDSFWKNETHVSGFVSGMHQQLRSNYTRFFLQGEARGGTMVSGNSLVNTSLDNSAPIKNNTFTANNTGVSGWNGIYGNILQINLFLKNVEEQCSFLSQESRNKYLAIGYGLRAMNYFLLYRTWGGVPVITKVKVLEGKVVAEELYTPRSTPKETLDFIKSDINKSESLYGNDLAIDDSRAYWSKYTTLMLKAEIYLWSSKVITGDQQPASEDLAVAKEALSPMVNGGKFSLMPKYDEVFTKKNTQNSEVIFALRFLDKEATNFGNFFVSEDAVFLNQVYGRDGNLITTDILNTKGTGLLRHSYKYGIFGSFNDNDSRRDATFLDYYKKDNAGNVTGGGVVLKKSLGSINSTNNRIYDADWIIYRYSDALLMMAEIENKQSGTCAVWVNKVRERAYGSNYDAFKYVDSDFETNELAILSERDKEFIWEGKRWFDVVRMQDGAGKSLVFSPKANYTDIYPFTNATEPILKTDKAYMVLWPVDISTLNNDPTLKQTPGYN